MSLIEKYPFELSGTFFAYAKFERQPALPDKLELQVEVGARIVEKRLPSILELQLKVATVGEQALSIQLLLVGLFTPIEGIPTPNHDAIVQFANERGFPVLWAYIDQIVMQMTTQMGMGFLRVKYPGGLAILPQPKRRARRERKAGPVQKKKPAATKPPAQE